MADKVSKLSVILSLDSRSFERSLNQSQKSMQRAGRVMTNIGKDLSIGLSLPLAIVAQRVTETATNFEYQMARVSAISGATGSEFGKLQANAEALGASTIFTAKEVGQLSEEFAKLGFTANEIVQVTESTLSLAQVTGAALPRAAEVSGAALRTFGLDASKVGQVNDVVAVAISKSALDFESFAETMKYAGSQAAISNVSMEELSAAMGVLANTGVKGSIAGTRLRMIFAKLSQEGGDVHQKFLDLINSNMTMAEAIERFGVRAATAIPVLQENRKEFFKLEKEMRESAGTLDIMQKKMDDTSFAAQKRLKSALEDLSIQIGKALLPMVNVLIEGLILITNGFAALPSAVQGFIVILGSVVAALGPFIFLKGKLMVLFASLQAYMPVIAAGFSAMLGPIGLISIALAGVVAGVYAFTQNGSAFASTSERIADATESAADATSKGTAKIRLLIDAFKNENRTLEEKQDILDELNRLQPDYFDALDAETTSVNTLKTAYDKLFVAMLKQERAKAFMSEINKIESERIQALMDQDEAIRDKNAAQKVIDDDADRARRGETSTGGFMVGTGGSTLTALELRAPAEAQGRIDDAQDIIDQAQVQIERIGDLMSGEGLDALLAGLSGSGGQAVEGGGASSSTLADFDLKGDGQSKALDKLSASLAEAQMKASVFGDEFNLAGENLKAYESALGSLITAGAKGEDVGGSIAFVMEEMQRLNEMSKEFEQDEALSDALEKMQNALIKSADGLKAGAIEPLKEAEMRMKTYGDILNELKSDFPEQTGLIEQMGNAYARVAKEVEILTEAERKRKLEMKMVEASNEAIIRGSMDVGKALGEVAASGEDAGKAMLEATSSALSSLITQLYLLYAKSVMSSATIPNPIAKLAALGVGAGILSGFIGNIPKLAQGGIAVGEQLVTVGDNRSGREAIIPLERLPGLMDKMGGGGSTRVYGSLKGTDIHISNMRGARVQQRII